MRINLPKLYNTYNGKTYRYNELPEIYKNAVDIYFKDEFDVSEAELNNRLYGCLEVPMKVLINIVMHSEVESSYLDFKTYHQDYIHGDDIPGYTEHWACILYEDEDFILDGWHRFHSYYEKGLDFVPCVFIIQR